MSTIIIKRRYLPSGTFSRLMMDGLECWTVELPWRNNAPLVSCIPEGVYKAKRITHSTKTHGAETFEIMGVLGRSNIQFHPANWAHQLQGCIAPGGAPCVIQGRFGVPDSQKMFAKIMALLEGEDEITVIIEGGDVN